MSTQPSTERNTAWKKIVRFFSGRPRKELRADPYKVSQDTSQTSNLSRKSVPANTSTSAVSKEPGGANSNPTVSKAKPPPNPQKRESVMDANSFFTDYGEANRYTIHEVIGKGSYGVVCSATDNTTGEKVAIKKITDVFEHVSDATRILREIMLLRHLKHPDIVTIKHVMLPPSMKDYKDLYVVFELMESDLHQVIKANDDLTTEHYRYFLYQLMCGLNYVHTANVFHRDLKPKNILANADCKLKICDFGLARPAFNDQATSVFWTDYVATRWYRAPELCGSFFTKYTPAIDVWGLGCIFAEVILGKPIFPGRNVVHQLELITDILGTPSADKVAKVRNEKARRFLQGMKFKPGIPFTQYFPKLDPKCCELLEKMLAFDPADRPTTQEALAHPFFDGMRTKSHEEPAEPISKMEFDFERRKLSKDDVRELIYIESLEYHPQMKAQYASGKFDSNFLYPSAVDRFKREFAHLEENMGRPKTPPLVRHACSLPRERVAEFQKEAMKHAGRERTETVSGQQTPVHAAAAAAVEEHDAAMKDAV